MSDIIRTIRDAIQSEVSAELGVGYKVLAYVEDVQKNSLRTSSDRYGVRPLGSSQIPGVTKFTTFTQSFEVVLTKGYRESSIDDVELVDKSLDNRQNMLAIYKRLVNNKGGAPSIVLNVFELFIEQPEYLTDDKVVVQRATMNITYRITLL